jgi:Tol biopolymer transport system component
MDVQILHYRQLTRDGYPKLPGVFTDGAKVYFVEQVGGRNVIAWVPVAGGTVNYLDVSLPFPAILAISPARHSLLLGSAPQLYELELGTMALRKIPLPPGAELNPAAWDPAGRQLALPANESAFILEPASTVPPLRLTFPGPVHVSGWDPQGRRLRFDSVNAKSNVTQWWELTANNRTVQPLPRFSSNPCERNGSWTTDGRFYVFEACDAKNAQIWIADTQRHPPQSYQLTNDARAWRQPTVVPGSSTILALAGQFQGQLVALPASGQVGMHRPVLPAVSAYELDFSRDGRWVAYTQFPEHTIWRSRPDGKDARQLTPVGLEAHQPHWSPDGTRIAFMGWRAGNRPYSRVYLVPSSGGALDEPLPGKDDQGVPTWSPDGRSLFFGDLRTTKDFERATIHELNLQTQNATTIAAPIGLWSPRMSPDGKYLAAISYDNRSLYMRDNLHNTWRNCSLMYFMEEPTWLRDSSWIQFIGISRSGGPRLLFRISPGCAPPRVIMDLSNYPFTGDTWIGISPDGSPLGLLHIPNEIYALDWRLRRRLP